MIGEPETWRAIGILAGGPLALVAVLALHLWWRDRRKRNRRAHLEWKRGQEGSS